MFCLLASFYCSTKKFVLDFLIYSSPVIMNSQLHFGLNIIQGRFQHASSPKGKFSEFRRRKPVWVARESVCFRKFVGNIREVYTKRKIASTCQHYYIRKSLPGCRAVHLLSKFEDTMNFLGLSFILYVLELHDVLFTS